MIFVNCFPLKPKLSFLPVFLLFMAMAAKAQVQDTTVTQIADTSTVRNPVASEGIYNRPFIGSALGISIGGYVDVNTNYFVVDGIKEGFSFEIRRFNIFVYSGITRRLKLFAELEFEHGAEEIALEAAFLDYEFSPSFVLRGGMILPPVGRFNTNHDSPRWEFVRRPLVSTQIIGATLHEAGVGVHGKLYPGFVTLNYDFYLTNGFGEGIISNDLGRTCLPCGLNDSQFEEDNNYSTALSGRVGVSYDLLGDFGVSFYTTIYNSPRFEGTLIEAPRRVWIFAFDFATEIMGVGLKGEAALAGIEVPDNLDNVLSERQAGAFLDIIVPVWTPRVFGEESILNVNLRLEAVDYFIGDFEITGASAGQEVYVVVPGISFRPSPNTVFKANYRRSWNYDLVGNNNRIGFNVAGFQFGFATYF